MRGSVKGLAEINKYVTLNICLVLRMLLKIQFQHVLKNMKNCVIM